MSRVNSRVIVRVAALVAFFTTLSFVEVLERVFLPVTLLLTYVPSIAAKVEVSAVMTAFITLPSIPCFAFPAVLSPSFLGFSFLGFSSSFS